MLKKILVSTLLKSVIAIMALALIVTFAISAWHTWSRLATTKQIMIAADISGDIFTALHNLRVDRSYSVRDLNADQPIKEISPALKEMRAADLPAMKSALAKLQSAVFPGSTS